MNSTGQFLLLLLWCLLSMSYGQNTKCLQVDDKPGCVAICKSGIFDLTPIAATDGIPTFKELKDPYNFVYTYNPCYTYREGPECGDVHICQDDMFDKYPIADAGTEEIYLDKSDKPFVHYSSGDREVRVHLHCTDSYNTTVTTTGDSYEFFVYEFDVYGCVACPGGCVPNKP